LGTTLENKRTRHVYADVKSKSFQFMQETLSSMWVGRIEMIFNPSLDSVCIRHRLEGVEFQGDAVR
jgi:hypothetical protein